MVAFEKNGVFIHPAIARKSMRKGTVRYDSPLLFSGSYFFFMVIVVSSVTTSLKVALLMY